MKYGTMEHNGKFYVSSGNRKFFDDTKSDTELAAKKRACEMSAQWYQQKMDECQRQWVSIREQLGEDVSQSDYDWGDVLA